MNYLTKNMSNVTGKMSIKLFLEVVCMYMSINNTSIRFKIANRPCKITCLYF